MTASAARTPLPPPARWCSTGSRSSGSSRADRLVRGPAARGRPTRARASSADAATWAALTSATVTRDSIGWPADRQPVEGRRGRGGAAAHRALHGGRPPRVAPRPGHAAPGRARSDRRPQRGRARDRPEGRRRAPATPPRRGAAASAAAGQHLGQGVEVAGDQLLGTPADVGVGRRQRDREALLAVARRLGVSEVRRVGPVEDELHRRVRRRRTSADR